MRSCSYQLSALWDCCWRHGGSTPTLRNIRAAREQALGGSLIPTSYAVAMGTGAVGNYLLGRWYDRAGLPVLVGAFLVGAAFTPLVFFGSPAVTWLGMALWGLAKGAQNTPLKPAIAPLIEADRRTTAFGIFDTCFGSAWLVGSIVFGLLYDTSLGILVTASVIGQLLSLPLFVLARHATSSKSRHHAVRGT